MLDKLLDSLDDDMPTASDNSVQEVDGTQPTDEELELLLATLFDEDEEEVEDVID